MKQSAFQDLAAGYLLFCSRKPATTGLFGWRKMGPSVLGDVSAWWLVSGIFWNLTAGQVG
jgi:hypothetical protein